MECLECTGKAIFQAYVDAIVINNDLKSVAEFIELRFSFCIFSVDRVYLYTVRVT